MFPELTALDIEPSCVGVTGNHSSLDPIFSGREALSGLKIPAGEAELSKYRVFSVRH